MLHRIKTLVTSQDGFTLIELMVVVGILAVLLLMSMSAMIGARARAQDSAAKATAAVALETGRVVFTDRATYSAADTATLTATEPSVRFVGATVQSDESGKASTDVPDALTTGHQFIAAVYSASGKCFFVRDWTTIGIGYAAVAVASPADCTAGNAPAIFGSRWPTG